MKEGRCTPGPWRTGLLLATLIFWPLVGFSAELQPGGQTIAGPGVFEGQLGDAANVYEAVEVRVLCVTLHGRKGTLTATTDGSLAVLTAARGVTIAACGEASVLTLTCDDSDPDEADKCEAEWRVDAEGDINVEIPPIPPTQVQVVGVDWTDRSTRSDGPGGTHRSPRADRPGCHARGSCLC